MSDDSGMKPDALTKPGPAVEGRIADPARLAALRALCLEDGAADHAFDRVTRLAAQFVGAPAALVNLVESDYQVTRSAFGPPGRYRRGDVAPLSDSICKFTIMSKLPVVIGDTHADPRSAETAAVQQGAGTYAGVPLVLASGHAVGTLCVLDDEQRVWTQSDLDILSDLAAAATTELELIAMTRAAESRAVAEANSRRLDAVLSISDAALTQATLDGTLSAILHRVRELLATDTATVLLVEEGGQWLRVSASLGLEGEVEAGVRMRFGEGIAGRIAATREPLIVSNIRLVETASPQLRATVQSVLGAPLLLNGELLGVIHVGSREPRAFEEDDVRLLVLAAARLAAAVERARLFDAERQARQAAEAASRAKTEFLAVVSHELRTPLNIIGGFVELLECGVHGALTPRQLEPLARIRAGQQQLAEVIGDILQHVASDQHAAGQDLALVAVGEVVERIASRMAARFASRSITFEHGAMPADVHVMAAPGLLQDIMVRILDNAGKVSPVGGVVVLRVDVERDRVSIIIRDSGPGIPPERIASIFEPFGRVDSSYRRSHEGIGLGLSIARARAREWGGDLTAHNVDGGGAEFILELPLSPSAAPATGS